MDFIMTILLFNTNLIRAVNIPGGRKIPEDESIFCLFYAQKFWFGLT